MLTGGDLRIASSDLDRDIEGFDGVYTLTVRARELGSFSAFTDTTFDITVTDVNDQIPRWGTNQYEITISEATQVGTQLVVMSVQDLDQGMNSEVAIFVELRHSAAFAVTPALIRGTSQVSLILNKPLDYETRKRIQFKVYANETQDPTHFAVTNVIINIENVNDNRPVFAKPLYMARVLENATKHTILLRVEASDADEGEYGRISYSITDLTQKFGIDPKSGEIILLRGLDREEINQYSVLVSASDGGMPSATASVTIRVTDINDNAPQFSRPYYTANVLENKVLTTPVATVLAWDADAPPNNEVTYSIAGSLFSRYFKVKKSTDDTGEIFLKQPLDFESIPNGSVKLFIIATDSGLPPLQATVSLVVTVHDVNDNAPVFMTDSSSSIVIAEDASNGLQIGKVRAKDEDGGKNKVIGYYVRNGREEFEKVFRLNEYNGDITIKPGSSPDYETISEYNVTIVAEDRGTPSLLATHHLLISVTDVNDNSPVFSQAQYILEFDEGTTPSITHVTATDADDGTNGEIKYAITGGNHANFIVNESSGEVTAVGALDYESTSGRYKLVVTATDNAEEIVKQLSSSVEVLINVIDVNDHAPVFILNGEQQDFIVYDVMEGVEGPRIDRFTALDADAGKNGFVTYSICKGNDEGLFSISHSEGDLRVTSGLALDHETVAVHNVTICAVDSGANVLNSTLDVIINVLDTNDNSPTFTKFHSEVRVREDTVAGTVLSRVLAIDLDDLEYGRVVYEVSGGNEDETFSVNKESGDVTLAKPLDRETVSEYILQISAKDSPKLQLESRSTTKTMKITIADVNDNIPRFVEKLPFRGEIEENSDAGSVVQMLGDKILAIDDDAGRNAVVSYSIVSDDASFVSSYGGTHSNTIFGIDSKSGTISTRMRLDREALTSDKITLLVRAADRNGLYSDVNVIIRVKDVNDNPPRFRSESMRVNIKEDAKPGTEVVRAIATDRDVGVNAEIRYSIQNGAFDSFVIDPQTGFIRVSSIQPLDRERKSNYNVVVFAVDSGIAVSHSSSCAITIDIDDVNDSRPKFNTPEIHVQIKENSPDDKLVATLRASDPDLTSDLQYSIVQPAVYDVNCRQLMPRSSRWRWRSSDYDVVKSWFRLNATSGEITVAANKLHSIDRELCRSVEMLVSVRDLLSTDEDIAQSLHPAIVTIIIEDVNDNSPVFVTSSSNGDATEIGNELIVDINEEMVIGAVLVTLKAVDYDAGNNGQVVYEITEGANIQLRDQEYGTLTVASRIDREQLLIQSGSAWVNATVLARDLGFPDSRTKLKVSIRVSDINDNKPVFEKKKYKVSVFENITIGSEVVKVLALDLDSGLFGDIVYSLKGGREVFSIHPVTGIVQVLALLDRESVSSYDLVVVATDNEKGPKYDKNEASVPLIVNVIDVNDCPPVFTEPRTPRTYTTQENARVGSFIAVVSAKDLDEDTGAQMTFSLKESRISDFFHIQPSSGHITVQRALTALPRHVEELKLEVISTDSGGLSSNMTLYLDVVDVNDHAPLFTDRYGREISIYEEEAPGTTIGFISATDADSGLNGIIRYSFCDARNNQATDSFLIDEVTGRIVAARRLDRESIPQYSLQVCASDLGVPSLQSSALVTVNLLDRNDNEPNFPKSSNSANGRGAYQELHASEDLPIGQSVGHVTYASDRDTGTNALVYYHLVSATANGIEDDAVFLVQRESGRIIVKKTLDREKVGRYSLVIKATNDKSYSSPLSIVSRKENRKKASVVVKRDVKPITKTRSPEANGVDMSTNISNESASIWSSASMSLRYDPSQDLSLIEVVIVIDDVNDERPIFKQRQYITAVDVQAKAGTEVLKVAASDNDFGVNSIVTYAIMSTVLMSHDNRTKKTIFNVFKIYPREGAIMTASRLEDYQSGYLIIYVEARDSANHRAVATVYVHIIQATDKIRFVVNSPPSFVREKKNEFVQLLGNVTSSHAIIDNIEYHTTSGGFRDDQRSDITIRAFNLQNMRQYKPGEMKKRLDENQSKLEKLFGICAIIRNELIRPNQEESVSLQTIVIIMLIFLLLIVLIFSALYCHMQRRYKRELDAQHANSVARGDMDRLRFSSHEAIVPSAGFRYSDPGASAAWKEEYARKWKDQRISEDEEFSSGENDWEPKKKRRPAKVSQRLPKSPSYSTTQRLKQKNKSSIEKSKGKGLTRSSTDSCVPKHHKLPVRPEDLQDFMDEKARRRKVERRVKPEDRRHEDPGSSRDSKRRKRISLKHDTSSLKRSGQCNVSNSDSTIKAEQTKPKEKIIQNKEIQSPSSRAHYSPELSLHSGYGNSEDISARQLMKLHGSENSELDKEYLDSDDTPTNMSLSSQPCLTSSALSVNLTSNL